MGKSSTASDVKRETDVVPYVLVTPARNEAAYIGLTLESMARQTFPPLRWVIVSDGSTDGTDEIVTKYAATLPWIELVRLPERRERTFAGKVHAFNAGWDRVKTFPFEVVGNMDADISFGPDHFEYLMGRFADDNSLGVAGTPFVEDSTVAYDYTIVDIQHVSGQCQLFRRRCFDEIGGYVPIEGGGIDWVAVTTARMKGWKTKTFTERTFFHHRPMGTGKGTLLTSRFRFGKQDYYLGGHPLWEIFRSVYHMRRKPYLAGGIFLLAGYAWGFLKGEKRPISPELVAFRRKEQMQRLKGLFDNLVGISAAGRSGAR